MLLRRNKLSPQLTRASPRNYSKLLNGLMSSSERNSRSPSKSTKLLVILRPNRERRRLTHLLISLPANSISLKKNSAVLLPRLRLSISRILRWSDWKPMNKSSTPPSKLLRENMPDLCSKTERKEEKISRSTTYIWNSSKNTWWILKTFSLSLRKKSAKRSESAPRFSRNLNSLLWKEDSETICWSSKPRSEKRSRKNYQRRTPSRLRLLKISLSIKLNYWTRNKINFSHSSRIYQETLRQLNNYQFFWTISSTISLLMSTILKKKTICITLRIIPSIANLWERCLRKSRKELFNFYKN